MVSARRWRRAGRQHSGDALCNGSASVDRLSVRSCQSLRPRLVAAAELSCFGGIGLSGIRLFGESDRAVLQMGNQLWRKACFLQMVLIKISVDRAHRFDILLPQREQNLDVSSRAQASRRAAANSLGLLKLDRSVPDSERSTHGPNAGAVLGSRRLRTPSCSRS